MEYNKKDEERIVSERLQKKREREVEDRVDKHFGT